MSSPESKHNALAEAIAKICADKVNPTLLEMRVDILAIKAKLDLLDTLTPQKRAPRASAKPAAAAKAGAKAAGNKTAEEKVTNALLFFRYALKCDLDNGSFRATYADDDAIASVAADPQVLKKDRSKDEGDYFSTVGAALWKGLADETRKEIRTQFEAWGQEREREKAEPPLEEEPAAGEEA